jgi:hypothetical protein
MILELTWRIYEKRYISNGEGVDIATFSPLMCYHCSPPSQLQNSSGLWNPEPSNKPTVYPYVLPHTLLKHSSSFQVPHEYRYLREHIALHHNEMLVNFDKGWASLPLSAKQLWSSKGNFPSSSLSKMSNGFPTWENWANSFRAMWNQKSRDMEKELVYWRSNWKFQVGGLNVWNLPDVNDGGNNVLSDMSLALDGYYLMKEFIAIREFGQRWRDDRPRLWREIVEFWQVGDILPDPPQDPPHPVTQGWPRRY